MPLEIRELVIKASVGDAQGTPHADSTSSGGGGEQEQTILVNLCVEKVLEILKEKNER